MGAAKRLAKMEIRDESEMDKLDTIIKDYPEWLKVKEPTKDFGMDMNKGDALTAEQKRMKDLGMKI